MKKIVVLIASVAFMASNAFANPTALVTRVQTVTTNAKVTATGLSSVSNVIVANAAANQGMETELESIVDKMENALKSSDDVINGISKKERILFLNDLFVATAQTKNKYDLVQALFGGKVLDAVLGIQEGEDKLDANNVEKFRMFLKDYIKNLKTMEVSEAAEAASLKNTGKSLADFIKACESAGRG